MVIGQVLGHGVPLVICSDLLLVRIDPSVGGEPRLAPVPLGADGADPGVIGPRSQVLRPLLDS